MPARLRIRSTHSDAALRAGVIRLVAAAFLAGVLLLGAPLASAFPTRVALLPNGSVNSCANCHVNPAGGGPRNPFGQAVEATIAEIGEPFWGLTDLHLQDSDGDGRANGVELNDPDGVWRAGQADPGGFVTLPGIPDAPTPTPTSTPSETGTPTVTPTATPTPLPTQVPTPQYDLALQTLVSGLYKPTFAVVGHDGRLFVGEHWGKILIANSGALFLDISVAGLNRVTFGEPSQGLLCLAFHPQYETNGRYFLSYTRIEDGAVVVREYRVSSNPEISETEEIPILETDPGSSFHPGGMLQFGPDGLLYIAFGDGARGMPAQDPAGFWGKMLRIDVDRREDGRNYAIPADNPFVGVDGYRPEIFALGFRHPWRFSIDRVTGDIWLGDVGFLTVEEVNRVLPGRNYGWPVLEGDRCYVPPECDPTGFEPAVESYLHTTLVDPDGTPLRGGCSVTGGLVYRGSMLPSLQGKYVFGDYCSMLWSLEEDGEGNWFRVERAVLEWPDTPVHFCEDREGEILVVNHERGLIQRVVDAATIPSATPTPTSSPSPTPSPTPTTLPTHVPTPNLDLSLATVASGLDHPTSVVSPEDGTGRMFVTEQSGRVRILDATGALLPNPFLDVGPGGLDLAVVVGAEQGLASIAFHPAYETNRRFFISYTRKADSALTVSEFRATDDPSIAETAETVVLVGEPNFPRHFSGNLAFGPDGMLYVSLGEGTFYTLAQLTDNFAGKLLRIDVDRRDEGSNYAIPPDNPFVGNPAFRPEIFAYGLRNPWRFSFDRETGALWLGDVGDREYEEIDIVPPGGNCGWPIMEGSHCLGWTFCDTEALVMPVEDYLHWSLFDPDGTPLVGGCSVIGGVVYRGADLPALRGSYVFGDYCTGIWSLQQDESGNWFRTRRIEPGLFDTFVHFGENEQGEIYVANHSQGLIQRISGPTPTPTPTPPPLSNLSTRGFVGEGSEVMIPGFIVEGTGTKRMLVSGIGPDLTNFGVPGALADPSLALLRGQEVLQANDNWGDSPSMQLILDTGLAPSHALESAILADLPPGEYTAILSGVASTGVGPTGIGLVQLFDLGGDARLRNLSTRLPVGLDERVMIAGITVAGEGGGPARRVVVRGLGPTLAGSPFGVPGSLADPELAIFSGQSVLETNANWRDAPDADQIAASGFAPPDDLEPAVLLDLAPGAYTAILSGSNSTEGVGLVEVYALE